ncbi:MAG: ComEC/Rec2 family competence protein, partial [Desulfomonilaceae bacterium]
MNLEIISFGVGHGDATLLRWKGDEANQSWTCLVDGGDSPERILQHLQTYNVKFLNLIIGTHPDSDHIGGLIGLADHLEAVDSYWSPPLPAFERHLWLFGAGCQAAIERCRAVEEGFKSKGTEVLCPVEGYSCSPFGISGPSIHIVSPAARLVRYLLTSDDTVWLFTDKVMQLGWIIREVEEEAIEQSPDISVLDDALSRRVLRSVDISDRLRRARPQNMDELKLVQECLAKTGEEPEFFGDSVLNNTSLVCWIEAPTGRRTHRILFPGDQENWTYLLAKNSRGLHADVMKAPHHGGRLFIEQDPAEEEVFSHVRPRALVISANGSHGLPRSSLRDTAIRWGSAVLCTADRSREIILGPANIQECCHLSMECENTSNNVELVLDSSGIYSCKRSCHPGLGSTIGPVIQIRQHIVDPSPVLDRLATHELVRHMSWVQKRLRKMHNERKECAGYMETGSEPLEDDQLSMLARYDDRSVLAAHLPFVLAKGSEQGFFWAENDRSYGPNKKWHAYTIPRKDEIRSYLKDLSKKIMILFPDSIDEVHRDADTLLTRLDTSGLADFADAFLHYPKVTFPHAFWPAVLKEFRNAKWHCYFRGNDVAFSRCTDGKQLLIQLTKAKLRQEFRYRDMSRSGYSLTRQEEPHFSLLSPVLVSDKRFVGKYVKDDDPPFSYNCAKTIYPWLPGDSSLEQRPNWFKNF